MSPSKSFLRRVGGARTMHDALGGSNVGLTYGKDLVKERHFGKYKIGVEQKSAFDLIANSHLNAHQKDVARSAFLLLAKKNRAMANTVLKNWLRANVKPPKEGFVQRSPSMRKGTQVKFVRKPIGHETLTEVFTFFIEKGILKNVSKEKKPDYVPVKPAPGMFSAREKVVHWNVSPKAKDEISRLVATGFIKTPKFTKITGEMLANRIIEVIRELDKVRPTLLKADIVTEVTRIPREEQRLMRENPEHVPSNPFAFVGQTRVHDILLTLEANGILKVRK